MATTADIRNGLVLDLEGQLLQVTYFQHVKPGKGSAFVRTKLRSVRSGNVFERTFRAGEKFEPAYLERKDLQFIYRADDDYFFPSPRGGQLHGSGIYCNFRDLLHRCGIGHGGRGEGPRLHDLRHTFAVHALLRWYREGAVLQARMPVLAAYLGHASIDGTQDYLQMTAELYPEIVARSDAAFSDVIPRRPWRSS